LLRSEDQGKTWDVLPGAQHGGWYCRGFGRMDEGRPIALGAGKVYMQIRTPEGHLWETRSEDDGKTWSEPRATPLIHPDAPPMLFHLSDGKTLAAFHHNCHYDIHYTSFDAGKPEVMAGRAQVWVAFSKDEGRTWSEPRFVLVNALTDTERDGWWNHQCSYLDMFVDGAVVNLFMPHRWRRALHLQITESDLLALPTRAELV
jgi:hypothetical protein